MRSRLLSLVRRQPIALLALFLALGGSSYAAVSVQGARSSPSDNTIFGCVGKNTGRLRVVDSPIRCGTLETSISFNREGHRGPQGDTGRRGPRGVDGARGKDGAAGLNGHDGAAGSGGAAGANGTDGVTGKDGLIGKDGAAGPNGNDGAPGAAGNDGAAGAAGQDGAAGVDGLTTLTLTSVEAAGANCAAGGVKFTVGIDSNRNKTLDSGEIDPAATKYVCDGAKGDPGAAGKDGLNGKDGIDGTNETPGSLLTKLKTVDGNGSGLDADTLDGFTAGDFVFTGSFPSVLASHFGPVFDSHIAQLFGTPDQGGDVNGGGGVDAWIASVYLTAATFPPPGTAFASGQQLFISQNQVLFALLGTQYGGNGVTTFRLPDLRKQAPAGLRYVIVMNGLFPSRP